MGKLARDNRSGRNGHRWKEQTKIVNNVTHALMPISKCYVAGISNVGKTYQTLAEVTSTHALQGSPTCSVPGKNSVSAPSLLLESSASLTSPPAAPAPRAHPCCCRWTRRPDRGKGPPVYDKICHCKRDRQLRREKSFKQQLCGPSKSCLKKTCQKERSVPSMPPAKHADASVQLLYYKDKLTATEQLVEKKDEIIRLQNESLALAEKRLATLTAARVELRRTHAPGPLHAPGAPHAPGPLHAPGAPHAPGPLHVDSPAPTQQKQSTYRARIQDVPMQSQGKQQQELVQTLRDNLSVMEELYRESFYEAAKQEDMIEKLRLSCYELRDMEASKAGEVDRLQHVLYNQQWTVEQCQRMSAEVERLKSEIYNFVNSSNNDSGVWEGEDTSPPEIREDLQDITSQLLKLRDILTENSSSADDENAKLKEQNTHLQKQISRLQSHIERLQSALSRQEHEHSCQHHSPVSGRVKSKCRPRTSTQCHQIKEQPTAAPSSVHGGRSQTMTAVRVGIDDTHMQEQDAEQSPRSTSSQARCTTCATHKCQVGAAPLTLLQLQLTSAQQRSAALCHEARRALARVRRWALRMRIRLREREQEIERQKQEIEELRKYINKLKDSSESKALSEKYALKKRILEDEEEHCKALRKEMEKIKYSAEEQDEEEDNIDDICEEREEELPLGQSRIVCKPTCPPSPDDAERDRRISHKCRHRPQCRVEPPRESNKSEYKYNEPHSSCYEINPGEIAEVDSPAGTKVLVKCRDCERKISENTHREIQTEGPRVTTYELDECPQCEPCPKPKKKDDKHCNEELCLMPSKKKEDKKPPPKSPPCVPCFRRPYSSNSRDTLVCHSNESLPSLRFREPAVTRRCPKDESPSPERQVSFTSRPEDSIEVPISLKCRPMRTGAKPDPCEPAYKLKMRTKKKDKKNLPKLDVKSSKKMFKDSKQRKDKKGEQKRCSCSGVCRCRCSTQAWKLEASSSRCSRCSHCSQRSPASPRSPASRASSLASQEDPRANSVDSYHSLLMGHLKKKFPFLVHRWGSCEASVQQPLRADASTSRSRPFEELVGAERKSSRPQPAPSNTLATISKVPQPRHLPMVDQQLQSSASSS